MNERLPKVFVNKIDKTLNVNQEATISSRKIVVLIGIKFR